MLKYSTNLTAEMVGMSASRVRTGRPTSLQDSADEMNRWAGPALGMKSVQLMDHSGLGAASQMSAADLVEALVQVHSHQGLRPILKPIALRNSKGSPDKNHAIKVDAKTGTLNFVSGLAGYMTAADGTPLAFAIFASDQTARSRIKRADRERPEGARTWNRRAKNLQQDLIERWGLVYGS
jgi:D-alanyl-D-alanine carboxypeptidase/D-alanyl-D-alanine-endopeptidase (penicillin-binding protein 4)